MKPSGGSVAGPRTLCFVSSSREKQVEFLGLAKTYLECNEPKLSLKCLSCAKEFQLSAQLCERLGKVRPSLRCRWENRAAPEPTPSAPACVREGPRASKEGHGSPEACRAVVLSTRPSVSTTPKMCARVHVCVKVCDPASVTEGPRVQIKGPMGFGIVLPSCPPCPGRSLPAAMARHDMAVFPCSRSLL